MSWADELDVELIESDVELNDSYVVEPDNDPPEEMGDPSVEVSQAIQIAADESKLRALDSVCEGNLLSAKIHLSRAIILNPKSALLFASRASVLVKLKKPNAAIRDADAALQIDSTLAKGYKARGMAKAMLGLWEEADKDLLMASKLDFDQETAMMLKMVCPNVENVKNHREKYENLRKERLLRRAELERQRRESEAALGLSNGKVIGINSTSILKTQLNAAAEGSRLAVLYFTARWCGPCTYISPEFTKFAKKYPNVMFLKADIDEARDAAMEWDIKAVPTFFFVKNERGVDQLVSTDRNVIEKKIIQHAG